MDAYPTSAPSPRKAFLDAVEACAALQFAGLPAHFVHAYRRAYAAARQSQPWLTEPIFRESFFRSVSRWFGGATESRYEQALAQDVATQGRRALASHL